MKEERAKRALRVYRGPDDPAPFSGMIRSMSFQCRNMDRLTDLPAVYALSRKTKNGGRVVVKRVGGRRPVDYIWTYGEDNVLYGLLKANAFGTVWFFNLYTGDLIKKIETDIMGLLVSCDEDGFHVMSAKNHNTPSMLTKYNYKGKVLSQVSFAAGEVYMSRSYKNYDILVGWQDDLGFSVNNTQFIYLYKDLAFEGALSFDTIFMGELETGRTRTSTRVMDAYITDSYIFLLVCDYFDFVKANEGINNIKVQSYVQVYDLDLEKLAESSKVTDHDTEAGIYFDLYPVGLRVENNIITYQYGFSLYVTVINMAVKNGSITLSTPVVKHPSILKDIWEAASGMSNSFGIIDGVLWRWYRNLSNSTDWVASYNPDSTSEDKSMKESSRVTLTHSGFSSLIDEGWNTNVEMWDVYATNYGLVIKPIWEEAS